MPTLDLTTFIGGQARIASNLGRPAEPITLVQASLTDMAYQGDTLSLTWDNIIHIDFGNIHRRIEWTTNTFSAQVLQHHMIGDKLVMTCVGNTRLELMPPGHSDCIEFPSQKAD